MFKKVLFSALIAAFLCTGLAVAQPTDPVEETVPVEESTNEIRVLNVGDVIGEPIDIIPALKQGIIYSIDDQEFSYAFTTKIISWKDITLEGGYSPADTLLGVVSYRLGGLEQFGVEVPILDLLDLNVGYYIGWKDFTDSDESKFDHGISATLLNIKF